jgi:hypothetical protein
MSDGNGSVVSVKILPNDSGTPVPTRPRVKSFVKP